MSDREKLTKFQPRIRSLLEKQGLTQKECAKLIEKDPRSFGHYATGNTIPDIEVLYKLAKKLHTSTDFLLGLSDNDSQGEFHEVKKNGNILQPIYRMDKVFMHNTVFNFYGITPFRKIIGIYVDNAEHEPKISKGSTVDVNCDVNHVEEDGYYAFDADSRYIIRRAYPVDFSDKIKIISPKGDEIEKEKTQEVVGKVVGIRQDFG